LLRCPTEHDPVFSKSRRQRNCQYKVDLVKETKVRGAPNASTTQKRMNKTKRCVENPSRSSLPFPATSFVHVRSLHTWFSEP
jgi:hypothetical protein